MITFAFFNLAILLRLVVNVLLLLVAAVGVLILDNTVLAAGVSAALLVSKPDFQRLHAVRWRRR